ncbi:MAG: glutamine--tRNA ligase/YqeY domain fusion protein [Chloroflexi bacterium]|nr:glutamine--tRNA ligase/YqeY domain fusion protein [Chloroflexota bacterium]MCY3581082.1 glutamine--tRNA ligase/YqeY domain fusion protein [Chloroflexota bacterium]MCY3715641.1 glutamine--tRNA ligase/YqeY domain fusion protein [Chloroflexota bacterium]MDE2650621.1 glutamine--tRNA ligase/YqeY domain fusion protein [Chloroflexota bacterium]MXV93479.1 glutamine--tRNA ligase/YqeY domain fusion protein [Chloroflexota bacterium]
MPEVEAKRNFITEIIDEHIDMDRFQGRVHTRFPPEPNGYLHIGHAKSICLNFGLAQQYGGLCNLRFDDTNPAKEEREYIDAIIDDVRWLGYDWGDRLFFASDYFEQLYEMALELIRIGRAYVDELSPDEIRAYRGTLTAPGIESPYRNRPVEENLALFEKMRAGGFQAGEAVLRAKIDMSSGNINLRDPVMYRIINTPHPRTGDTWRIYPMYDFAHGQSDSLEGITHSICTLEYEDHRPLYDWYLDNIEIYHPQQIEFARLNLSHTVLSKRKLIRLVQEGYVQGWDDPRMPTISGLRRRGYTPEAIRQFCAEVGVGKVKGVVALHKLEYHIRQDLNKRANRVMAVLNPLRVVIENYPQDQSEELDAINNPEDASAGKRKVPFSKALYIEREDFMEDPPRKFFRLAPGREVRLRYAYFITCREVIKDSNGEVIELRCTYDPATRGGSAPDGRRPKATLHWVSADHAIEAEARLYDTLFTVENPDADRDQDFTVFINPQSLQVVAPALVEPSLAAAQPGERYQFERLAYFVVDADSTSQRPVFNRIVTLRDQWKKQQQKQPRRRRKQRRAKQTQP